MPLNYGPSGCHSNWGAGYCVSWSTGSTSACLSAPLSQFRSYKSAAQRQQVGLAGLYYFDFHSITVRVAYKTCTITCFRKPRNTVCGTALVWDHVLMVHHTKISSVLLFVYYFMIFNIFYLSVHLPDILWSSWHRHEWYSQWWTLCGPIAGLMFSWLGQQRAYNSLCQMWSWMMCSLTLAWRRSSTMSSGWMMQRKCITGSVIHSVTPCWIQSFKAFSWCNVIMKHST